jgi:hypothetical protein
MAILPGGVGTNIFAGLDSLPVDGIATFIVAGQSNAGTFPNQTFTASALSNAKIWNGVTWAEAYTETGTQLSSLARRIAAEYRTRYPNRQVRILHSGDSNYPTYQGSTSFSNGVGGWGQNNLSESAAIRFRAFELGIKPALQSALTEAVDVYPVFVFWQGEYEAQTNDYDAYCWAEQFSGGHPYYYGLRQQLKDLTGVDVPSVIMKLGGTSAGLTHKEIIRTEQQSAANKETQISIVDTAGTGLQSDGIHHTASAHLALAPLVLDSLSSATLDKITALGLMRTSRQTFGAGVNTGSYLSTYPNGYVTSAIAPYANSPYALIGDNGHSPVPVPYNSENKLPIGSIGSVLSLGRGSKMIGSIFNQNGFSVGPGPVIRAQNLQWPNAYWGGITQCADSINLDANYLAILLVRFVPGYAQAYSLWNGTNDLLSVRHFSNGNGDVYFRAPGLNIAQFGTRPASPYWKLLTYQATPTRVVTRLDKTQLSDYAPPSEPQPCWEGRLAPDFNTPEGAGYAMMGVWPAASLPFALFSPAVASLEQTILDAWGVVL